MTNTTVTIPTVPIGAPVTLHLLLSPLRMESVDVSYTQAYGELRRIAGSLMRGRVNGHTLQPTALVNEAYLRLAGGENRWDNKGHFLGPPRRDATGSGGPCAPAVCEEAGRREVRVTFRDLAVPAAEPDVDVTLLDEAMTALSGVDQRFSRVMELRYFAGCSLAEIAELTGLSLATVKRDWTYARAWLHEYMSA